MRRLTTVVMVVGAFALVLATPVAGAQTATDANETAVGVEMDGWTAVGMAFDGDRSTATVRADVAANLSVPRSNVLVRAENGSIEVYGGNLSVAGIANGLAAAGLSPDAVSRGVSDRTRREVVGVLSARLEARGIDGRVQTVTVNGTEYVVVTGADRTTVAGILRNRGQIDIIAHFPVSEGEETTYRDRTILSNEDLTTVGPAVESRPFTNKPTVEVGLTVAAAREAAGIVKRAGFTDEGVTGCPDDAIEHPETAEGYCIYTAINGEIESARSLGGDLAWAINFKQYEEDPTVYLIGRTMEQAELLSMTLRTGMFPVPVSATELPKSAVRAALEASTDGAADEVVDDVANETDDLTPDTATPADTQTGSDAETPTTDEPRSAVTDTPTADESAETPAESATATQPSGVVSVTDNAGPGFTPLTAVLALVLAGGALLARVR